MRKKELHQDAANRPSVQGGCKTHKPSKGLVRKILKVMWTKKSKSTHASLNKPEKIAAVSSMTQSVTMYEDSAASTSTNTFSFRMVALDLDGTLLNSDHQPSQFTKDCLRQLDKKGFLITIATGRGISTVYETVKALNLPKPIPVVCSNGAEGYLCSLVNDGEGGCTVQTELLFTTPVPLQVAQRSLDIARDLGFLSQYYIGDEIFADPKDAFQYKVARAYIKLTGSKTQYVQDNFHAAMNKGLPSKLLILCRTSEQQAMIETYEEELAREPMLVNGKRATIIKGNGGWFLEVLHPDVCKGNGLKKMCQYLEIPIDECIAFGDGDNDFEFLQMAGRGYAMNNAVDVVKEIADEVIPYTNNDDGVARTLQSLEKQGCLVFAQ